MIRPLSIAIFVFLSSLIVVGQIVPASEPRKRIELPTERELMRVELSAEDKRLIEPIASDKLKYAGFLRLSDAKIIKILDASCPVASQVSLNNGCTSGIPGFGAHYSFRERRYFYPQLADVRLEQGKLLPAGFLLQTIFVPLGDVKIEELSLSSDGLQHLSQFVPAMTPKVAETQAKQFQKGLAAGSHIFYGAVKVVENNVYGLRVIAYDSKVKTMSVDPRKDVVLVFKVIRLENNGDATIVWRQLERKNAPKLKS